MTGTVVSKRIFEILVKHLIDMEEEKINVIEKFYPVWTNERSDFQETMNSYIKNVENFLYNELTVDDKATDACPFVIIGSNMLLKDAYTNKLEQLQIVSPFKGEINFDIDSASYLSPMGRAFLLKKINDNVTVETPMGIFEYKIEAIELPEDILKYDKLA